MKTIEDLTQAVKRYLTSNTQLVNLFQGTASDSNSLEDQIDQAILAAANNARKFAERVHEFSFNERIGRATLTGGCPLHLGHVPVKKFARDRNAFEMSNAIRLDWDENEWPELVLDSLPVKPNVESVSFHGSVGTSLVAGKKYHVIKTGLNDDQEFVLQLGITPGELPDLAGISIWADTAEIQSFKTVKQVNLYEPRTRQSTPIRTTMRRTESIRNQRIGMLEQSETFPGDDWTQMPHETQAVCNGEFVAISPTTAEDLAVTIDGNIWLKDYTTCSDTDEILTHGFDFMMWQSIIERTV